MLAHVFLAKRAALSEVARDEAEAPARPSQQRDAAHYVTVEVFARAMELMLQAVASRTDRIADLEGRLAAIEAELTPSTRSRLRTAGRRRALVARIRGGTL